MANTMIVMDHAAVSKLVASSLLASDALPDIPKRILTRRLQRRPRIRETVLDELISQAIGKGLIVIDGDQVLVDWEGLAAFLKEIIPLIITIIGAFG